MRLAELSKLSVDEEEITSLQEDLGRIVDYISTLSELDTEGIEPTYQCFELENVWREDEVQKLEAERADLLALSSETEAQQIKVPKVL